MSRHTRLVARTCIFAIACAACGGGETAREGSDVRAAESRAVSHGTPDEAKSLAAPKAGADAAGSGVARSAADGRPKIVALGDSLTAGLGLDPADAYPALLQEKLDAAVLSYRVVNAGVSGDTSAGGASRADLALEGDVRVLIVALGGNDALRALPVAELRRNLSTIIERARARGVAVVLAGMEAPPNFGPEYVAAFRDVYASLAAEYRVALLPFLLDGVAGIDRLNQRDGIHPTAEGARLVADHLWPVLEPLVRADARMRVDAKESSKEKDGRRR
jgi:acyl-CoA thioesterase I